MPVDLQMFLFLAALTCSQTFQTLSLLRCWNGWLYYFLGYWLTLFKWKIDLFYGLENTKIVTGGFFFPRDREYLSCVVSGKFNCRMLQFPLLKLAEGNSDRSAMTVFYCVLIRLIFLYDMWNYMNYESSRDLLQHQFI